MKKINIYYGPKKEFEKTLLKLNSKKTLAEIISEYDEKLKRHILYIPQMEQKKESENVEDIIKTKEKIENLIAYSESYSGITEGAVQSFVTILNEYEIENLYLQNPPVQIVTQLEQTFNKKIIKYKQYDYKKLTIEMFKKINSEFDNQIIGQEKAREKLLVALYPLINQREEKKPIVIMFYGPSGVGKTETAKFISNILGQKMFRKQFSMFQNVEFSSYLFGGKHFQECFGKDLLERESNVILLDEFDKSASVFHSAFYQLFDEGIFEDKNYRVELKNSIIICTSNYNTSEDIRKNLGDPIYYRFNSIIKFEQLSNESMNKIIDKLIDKKYKELTKDEKKIINKTNIKKIISPIVNKINNVRSAEIIIQELIGMELVKNILKDK